MIAEWILIQFKTSGFLPGSQILTSSHPHPHSLIFIFQSSLTGFGKASIILRYPQILLCIWKMLAVVWGGQKQGEKHNTKIFFITVLNEYMSLCHYSAAEWISWIESHWIECMNAFQTSRARCQGLADEKGNVMSSVTVRFRSKVLFYQTFSSLHRHWHVYCFQILAMTKMFDFIYHEFMEMNMLILLYLINTISIYCTIPTHCI